MANVALATAITAISRGIEKPDGNQIANLTLDRALTLKLFQKNYISSMAKEGAT